MQAGRYQRPKSQAGAGETLLHHSSSGKGPLLHNYCSAPAPPPATARWRGGGSKTAFPQQ
eukprot:508292-Pyramimonas_sp.AAC.1